MPDGSIPALTILAPQSATADHPDAELIRLCSEFLLIDRQWDKLNEQSVAMTPEMDGLALRLEAIVNRVMQLGCHTLEGLRALASVLRDADLTQDDPSGAAHDRLPGLVIRSLLQGVEASPDLTGTLTPTAPDADLIAACAEFDRLERAWLATGFSHDDDTPEELAAEAERDRIRDAQDPLLDRITAQPPATMVGAVTLARTITLENLEVLKENYGSCSHDRLLTTLLRGLVEQQERDEPISTDLGLIKAASEFCRIYDSYEALDFGVTPGAPEEERVLAAQKQHLEALRSWAQLLGYMRATTDAGLAARARALGRNDARKDLSYDEAGTLSDMLLKPLLLDSHAMAVGRPAFNPDADLLALRPEFERALAEHYRTEVDDITDEELTAAGEAFDDIGRQILAMPPAVTQPGRALQAIATLYQLTYLSDWEEGQEPHGAVGVVWNQMVAQVDGAFPIPGTGIFPYSDTEDPAAADVPLLALKPELDRLHDELQAALQKNPARGGKKATRRKFDEIVAQAVRMPKARTVAGLQFQKHMQWLAQARGLEIIRETRA